MIDFDNCILVVGVDDDGIIFIVIVDVVDMCLVVVSFIIYDIFEFVGGV